MCYRSRNNKKYYKSDCPVCKHSHSFFQCPDFLKLLPFGKYNLVKDKKPCLNCLSFVHKIGDCKSTNVRNTPNCDTIRFSTFLKLQMLVRYILFLENVVKNLNCPFKHTTHTLMPQEVCKKC